MSRLLLFALLLLWATPAGAQLPVAGVTLATRQAVTLTAASGQFQTAKIAVSPQTSQITVRLRRPTTLAPLAWLPSATVRVTLGIIVDGVEWRATTEVTGGVAKVVNPRTGLEEEIPEYRVQWAVPVLFGDKAREYLKTATTDAEGYYTDVPLTRLGETGSTIEAYLRLERLRGTITTEITVAVTTEAPAPLIRHKNSVAFGAGTALNEIGGDQAISFSHTASGADRDAFIAYFTENGVSPATHNAPTYAGTSATSIWNVLLGNERLTGWHVLEVGVPTGVQTVAGSKTGGGTVSAAGLICVTLTGVNQTTPIGTAVTTSATTGATPSVTVAGITADGLLVDAIAGYAQTGVFSFGADQTERAADVDAELNVKSSTQPGSIAGGVMSWSKNSNWEYLLGAVEFKAAAGGGGSGAAAGSLGLMGVGR